MKCSAVFVFVCVCVYIYLSIIWCTCVCITRPSLPLTYDVQLDPREHLHHRQQPYGAQGVGEAQASHQHQLFSRACCGRKLLYPGCYICHLYGWQSVRLSVFLSNDCTGKRDHTQYIM
jgi:hypothetical protein